MTDASSVRRDSNDELKLEIEALEERVAPGLLLGVFAGASVSASAGVTVQNPWWAPPPPPTCGWGWW